MQSCLEWYSSISHTSFLVIWNLLLLTLTRRYFASGIGRRQFASVLVWKSVQEYLVFYIMLYPDRALEHFTNNSVAVLPQALGKAQLIVFFSSHTRQAESYKLVFRFLLAPSKHCLGKTECLERFRNQNGQQGVACLV